MTTLAGRPNAALLVIDPQNGVLAAAESRDSVLKNIDVLVARARAEGAPVIWVQHSDEGLPLGSPEWKYVPELVQQGGEPRATATRLLVADQSVYHDPDRPSAIILPVADAELRAR